MLVLEELGHFWVMQRQVSDKAFAGPLGALVGGYSDADWLYNEARLLHSRRPAFSKDFWGHPRDIGVI